MSAQAPWVFWVVAFLRGREKGEIPVFGDVPIKRVERVQKDEEKPAKRIRVL